FLAWNFLLDRRCPGGALLRDRWAVRSTHPASYPSLLFLSPSKGLRGPRAPFRMGPCRVVFVVFASWPHRRDPREGEAPAAPREGLTFLGVPWSIPERSVQRCQARAGTQVPVLPARGRVVGRLVCGHSFNNSVSRSWASSRPAGPATQKDWVASPHQMSKCRLRACTCAAWWCSKAYSARWPPSRGRRSARRLRQEGCSHMGQAGPMSGRRRGSVGQGRYNGSLEGRGAGIG